MSYPNNRAGFESAGSFVPDSLHAGDFPIRTEKVTLESGQTLQRGALLGKVTIGELTAEGEAGEPAPAGATITATPDVAPGTQIGVHRFECVVGGSGAASKWNHYAPDGSYVGTASGDTEYTGGGLTLTIADAGADPSPGEAFIVTVSAAAGSGEYKLSAAAATDGSNVPVAILAEDVDTSDGAAEAVVYVSGDFNADAITYGAGHTAASVKDGLRALNIYLHDPVNR